MKICVIVAALFLTTIGFAQTARNYYDEIYKAGGLDRMADEKVCFADEQNNQNFFIFAQSTHMKELLIAEGVFAKLPKAAQQQLNGNFLLVRGYTKGVPMSEEEFYDNDNDSWVLKDVQLSPTTKARIRLNISWSTLRYKRTVEVLSPGSKMRSEVAQFGRCEVISPDVRQKE